MQDALVKSNEVFETFKQEIDKVTTFPSFIVLWKTRRFIYVILLKLDPVSIGVLSRCQKQSKNLGKKTHS